MALINQRINISISAEPPVCQQPVEPTDPVDNARKPIRWNFGPG